MKRACLHFTCLLLLSFSGQLLAKGLSPYLPLNLAPEVELQIQKLMAITGGAPLTKPYKATEIVSRLEEIKDHHPLMHRRLSAYLERYTQKIANTHRAIVLAAGKDHPRTLKNNRGVKHNTSVEISAAGHVFFNPWFYVAAGASYSDESGKAATNTHFGMGNEFVQLDLGFREHWFSPFQDSAMLLSTHGENAPSLTLSNSTGITDFNLRYEFFYSQFDEDTNINANGDVTLGKPRLTGMHVSFNPTEKLTLGLSKTFFYGGGNRDGGLDTGLQGLLSASSVADNDIDNLEQGYGQSALTAKWNLGQELPVSLYAEFAQYESDDLNNIDDSGNAISLGVFFPILFENMSFRYEVTDRDQGWYESAFYPNGVRNKGHVLGHWSADEFTVGISPGAQSHHILMDWELINDQLLAIKMSRQTIDDIPGTTLESTFQLNARYSVVTQWGFVGLEGTIGKDALGDSYNRLSAFYRW